MSVKINIKEFGNNGFVNILTHINNNNQIVDQSEVIERKFVETEIKKNINPIIDYEKVRLEPIIIINGLEVKVDNITYQVHFKNNDDYNPLSFYSEIGFNNSDILFRKNSFKKTFLKLNFYDSDIQTSQRLISFNTLYPELNNLYSDNANGSISANQLPITFNLGNTLINKNKKGEGYFLYHFKDEVVENLPKELYMRADFNNAKTGVRTRLMSTNIPNNTIDNLIVSSGITNNIHTKYILIKKDGKYIYTIDSTYSDNVIINNNNYIINLYEISAI